MIYMKLINWMVREIMKHEDFEEYFEENGLGELVSLADQGDLFETIAMRIDVNATDVKKIYPDRDDRNIYYIAHDIIEAALNDKVNKTKKFKKYIALVSVG